MSSDAVPHDELFDPPQSAAEIRQGSARSMAITTAAKAGVTVMRAGTFIVIARILHPEDFGIVAMVMSVLGIATLFRDMGLSAATVRLPSITATQVNTLFWINCALGALVTAVGVAVAPLIQAFFADPRLTAVTMALASTFLFSSLGAQHLALLRRRLRFADLARINLVTGFVTSALSLALALAGFAYWALVISAIAGPLVTSLHAFYRSGWRPAAPAFDPSVRPMLSFGGYVVGFGILGYLGLNLQALLIGRFWGAAAVGLYVRAAALFNQPLNYLVEPLRIIVPPALARMATDAAEFRDHYVNTLALMIIIVAPGSVWIAIMGTDLVRLLLGPHWGATGELLQILALAAVPQVLSYSTGWLYMSRGNARRMLQWGALGWTVVILCAVLGTLWGVTGIAVMYVASMYLIVVPSLAFAGHDTGIALADVGRVLWRPVLSAAAGAAVLVTLLPMMAGWHIAVRLVASAAVLGGVHLLLLVTVLGERRRMASLVEQIRGLTRRGPRAEAA